MKPISVFVALLGAAAAGAAVGMMFAPRKGSELRESVMDYVRKHCKHGTQ